MRALLVEDQRQMRAILRKMLQQMKYFESVDEAEDGERAWARLTAAQVPPGYDLVICDMNMPGLDGLGLLQRCRQFPEFCLVPFIMISSSSQSTNVVSALGEWNASDFLVKPFSFEMLQKRVGSVVKRMQGPEESLFRRASQFLRKGNTADALKLIEYWERDTPQVQPKWLNLKGECLLETGEHEKAVLQFEDAMTGSSMFIAAYKNYAKVHSEFGDREKAIQALQHVEEISPTNTERTFMLGRLLLDSGREEEGRILLDGLIKRSSSKEKDRVARKVADIYLGCELFKEAESVYASMLHKHPGEIETANQLGIALRQQGKYSEAEAVYITALMSHPNHAGLHHNLGILHMAQEEYAKAFVCFRKALELDPEIKEARIMLERLIPKRRKSDSG